MGDNYIMGIFQMNVNNYTHCPLFLPPSWLARYEHVAKKDPEVIYICWGQNGE